MDSGSPNSASDLSLERRIYRQSLVILWIALLLSWLPQDARGAQSSTEEYQVKAAFLFHFAQFVDWPASVLNGSDPSLRLCIFEDEPRRQELKNTLEGKSIGPLIIHVRQINQSQEIQGCNILFLSRDEARHQAEILNSLRGLPVLTVGETPNFLSDGGMIRFHLDQDKVRFDINAGVADSSHIRISSQLLLLATSVILGGGSERGTSPHAH
jgi:hypothetical protein